MLCLIPCREGDIEKEHRWLQGRGSDAGKDFEPSGVRDARDAPFPQRAGAGRPWAENHAGSGRRPGPAGTPPRMDRPLQSQPPAHALPSKADPFRRRTRPDRRRLLRRIQVPVGSRAGRLESLHRMVRASDPPPTLPARPLRPVPMLRPPPRPLRRPTRPPPPLRLPPPSRRRHARNSSMRSRSA